MDPTYGHIEIYTGNNTMIGSGDPSGIVKERTINSWYWERYTGWGWYNGVELVVPPPPKKEGSVMSKGAGQTIPDGDYWIMNPLKSGYYLDPAGGTDIPAANKSNVMMCAGKSFAGADYDAWTVTYLNNGFYKIAQKGTDMCLDSTGATVYAEENVQLHTQLNIETNTAQQWSIEKNGDYFRLRPRCSGFSLDVKGGGTESGTNAWIYENNDSAAQKFTFVPFEKTQFKGKGTKEDPYQISTADELCRLSELVNDDVTAEMFYNKHYVQTADIDLSGIKFTPIGAYTEKNKGTGFSGVYDGNYHVIKNLKVI